MILFTNCSLVFSIRDLSEICLQILYIEHFSENYAKVLNDKKYKIILYVKTFIIFNIALFVYYVINVISFKIPQHFAVRTMVIIPYCTSL